MRVSVVIPCYNSQAHLERTAFSALAQNFPPLEILCIDDCSVDSTWEIIKGLESRSGGVVRGIRHEANSGTPAISRNTGILAARGDWVAFVDHDDLWLPEKLARQQETLARNPGAALLHSNFWEEWNDDPKTRRLMHDPSQPPPATPLPRLFFKNLVVCHSVVMRREVFDKVGLMTEDPRKRGSTDYDMWLRVARGGHRFGYCAEPLGVHRRHTSNLSRHVAWHLRGKLAVLEDFLRTTPRDATRIGRSAARARLLWTRLELAHALLRAGDVKGGEQELRECWRLGAAEFHVWRLRAKLAIGGIDGPGAARRVRRTAGRFRRKSLRHLGG